MKVGFTGTREGMSFSQQEQLSLVMSLVHSEHMEFHHGGASGADDEADAEAEKWIPRHRIVVHPCPGVVREDIHDGRRWLEVFPPLVRNRHIVDAAEILIAAPRRDREEQRSGTWATVRLARKKGLPVVMLSRGER